MRTLLIDNYDSFTYNLYHLLRVAAPPSEAVDIRKNDGLDASALLHYDHVVASPGPGVPHEAGDLMAAIGRMAGHCAFLGICLGHQALAEWYGATLRQLPHPAHGETAMVSLVGESRLFEGLRREIQVARYHSWVVERASLPECLQVTAVTAEGQVMALQHRELPLYGVQFHPESFMTPDGVQIIKNFYRI